MKQYINKFLNEYSLKLGGKNTCYHFAVLYPTAFEKFLSSYKEIELYEREDSDVSIGLKNDGMEYFDELYFYGEGIILWQKDVKETYENSSTGFCELAYRLTKTA